MARTISGSRSVGEASEDGRGMSEPSHKNEVDHLFDATVRRMLKTPPKPHEDMKLGKPKRKREKDDGEQPRRPE